MRHRSALRSSAAVLRTTALIAVIMWLPACLTSSAEDERLKGVATSEYPGYEGRRTASGELYDSEQLTCGHRSLPFGTVIKVTSLKSQKSVIVRVNDRGPFQKNRVLNLSAKAAEAIGIELTGSAPVTIEILTQS